MLFLPENPSGRKLDKLVNQVPVCIGQGEVHTTEGEVRDAMDAEGE